MITLVTFPPAFGLRNVSPFCLKVEMALAHLDIEHDIRMESDPRKAPKGKLPYIIADGQKIADSELIFEYLDEVTQGGLYGSLTDEEKALGLAWSRLAEDHLYWLMVASRWLDEAWFPNIVEGFFGFVPGVFRAFAARAARQQVRKTYDLQGLGRHSPEEQLGFARRDLDAIAAAVTASPYIVGGRLTVFDFVVAGLLSGLMDNQPPTWMSRMANEYPALRDYLTRIEQEVGVQGRL